MSITKAITKFNQSNKLLKAVGGIQHSTGNGEDTAKGNVAYFNGGDRGANAHAFIDSTGIYQTVEFDKQAWHARSPANGCRWGSEMCETKDKVKFKQIWANQVWLWAYLFTQVAKPMITKIDINTLRSHHEENNINHKGDGENHTDPDGYFKLFGKTMEDMRKDVQTAINVIIKNGGKL